MFSGLTKAETLHLNGRIVQCCPFNVYGWHYKFIINIFIAKIRKPFINSCTPFFCIHVYILWLFLFILLWEDVTCLLPFILFLPCNAHCHYVLEKVLYKYMLSLWLLSSNIKLFQIKNQQQTGWDIWGSEIKSVEAVLLPWKLWLASCFYNWYIHHNNSSNDVLCDRGHAIPKEDRLPPLRSPSALQIWTVSFKSFLAPNIWLQLNKLTVNKLHGQHQAADMQSWGQAAEQSRQRSFEHVCGQKYDSVMAVCKTLSAEFSLPLSFWGITPLLLALILVSTSSWGKCLDRQKKKKGLLKPL